MQYVVMDIHDMWNYPVSRFLRLLTHLYTEREKETVIIPVFNFTGDEDRANRGDKGGRGRSTTRKIGALGRGVRVGNWDVEYEMMKQIN